MVREDAADVRASLSSGHFGAFVGPGAWMDGALEG